MIDLIMATIIVSIFWICNLSQSESEPKAYFIFFRVIFFHELVVNPIN